jgi:hypothetical protein
MVVTSMKLSSAPIVLVDKFNRHRVVAEEP